MTARAKEASAKASRPALLIVSPYFPPAGGGLESYVRNLALLLSRQHGWRVVVAASARGLRDVERNTSEGLTIYRLPTQVTLSNTPLSARWRGSVRRICEAERIDVINAHAPVPGLADIAAGASARPFVLTYHAGPMKKGVCGVDAAIRLYERVLLPRLVARSQHVICSSRFVRDAFEHCFFGKASVVSPGVDPQMFAPATAVRPGAEVLFVGSLARGAGHKGLGDLLRVVARLRVAGQDLRLNVVGDGSDRDRWEAAAAALGIADIVRFHGRLAGRDLVRAYQAATVVALPSHNDSMPTVLLEAMSCERPVVSTSVGDIPRLIGDGKAGLLVPSGDDTALTDAISRLLTDPDLRRRLGTAGRAIVLSDYTWARQAVATNEILQRALRRGRGERFRRVAVVAPYFPPQVGGAERYAHQVATAVQRSSDFDVVVVTSARGWRTRREYLDELPVVRLGAWITVSNTPIGPLWPLQLRRVLRRHRVDLVHAHTPVPGMADAAALVVGRRRQLVLTYHAGSMVKQRLPVDWLLRLYERIVLPRVFARAVSVVGVSPAALTPVGYRSRVIPPGVDTRCFVPAVTPVSDGMPAIILYVGRIDRSCPWKGLRHLVDAFALIHAVVPAARLELVGDGDATTTYERRAAALGVASAVAFRGPLTGADLVAAYQRASVVVLPSTTAAESFGMCLVEAMACGRPVVGSRVGGIPHLVDDGREGLLVPPGDPAALAVACLRVLSDPALAAALAANGRRKAVSMYDVDGQTAAYLGLFRQLGQVR